MENRPLLTIAIPTYNRYAELKQCLDSIAQQYESSISDKIEIVISDNGSTDQTEKIVDYPAFRKLGVRYFRSDRNRGPDQNFFVCWTQARGKYVQLLSDDDVLLPDAIGHIFEVLERDPNVVYLNYARWSRRNQKNFGKGRITEYWSNEEFLIRTELCFTTLSCMVLKRDGFRIDQLKAYDGTFYTHVHAMIDTMKSASNAHNIIQYTPVVALRPGNQRGYNLYHTWFVDLKQAVDRMPSVGCSKEYVRDFYGKAIKNYIWYWVYDFRKNGTKLDMGMSLKVLFTMMRIRESWIYLFPVMILPVPILTMFLD